MKCSRCGVVTLTTTMSRFNTDICCEKCIRLEKQHPEYQTAFDTEFAEVKKGNYDFAGIGLPIGYNDWAREQCLDF